MRSPNLQALRTVCKQYGPGRLPRADSPDVGAGYAAASAAVAATFLYWAVLTVDAALGANFEGVTSMAFVFGALPFVVPAAFVVGLVGWRLLPSYGSLTGLVAGGLGAVATYLLSLVTLGVVLTVAAGLSLTGTDPVSAATFAGGLVAVAFVLTWWVTVPVGLLSGLIYVNAVGAGD